MDGVDASKFLLGQSEETGRETLLFFGPDGSLMSTKWRQVKVVFRHCAGIAEPIIQPQFPMVFDLGSDPGERYNLFNTKLDCGWMLGIGFRAMGAYEKSIAQYPNIKPGEEFTGYKKVAAKSA
jgi:arylsulfatase